LLNLGGPYWKTVAQSRNDVVFHFWPSSSSFENRGNSLQKKRKKETRRSDHPCVQWLISTTAITTFPDRSHHWQVIETGKTPPPPRPLQWSGLRESESLSNTNAQWSLILLPRRKRRAKRLPRTVPYKYPTKQPSLGDGRRKKTGEKVQRRRER
jgi:hypothetical protein